MREKYIGLFHEGVAKMPCTMEPTLPHPYGFPLPQRGNGADGFCPPRPRCVLFEDKIFHQTKLEESPPTHYAMVYMNIHGY